MFAWLPAGLTSPFTLGGVLAFVAFYLIARVVDARQSIALAFGLTPLMLFWLFSVVLLATMIYPL